MVSPRTYQTDWNFEKTKFVELVNTIHPYMLIIPTKFVFIRTAMDESAIQETWELAGSSFAGSSTFSKFFPDIIKFTRE